MDFTALIGFMAFGDGSVGTPSPGTSSRQTYYAESNGTSTTTSTSFQDKTTLTFTPDDNSDYYIFWCASVNISTTSSDVNAKLINSTTATDLAITNIEAQDTLNWHPIGGVVRQQFTTGHGSQTYKIQYDVETALTTAGIRDARILAIKADALDQYVVSDADSTTTSATQQDKATLTFTPGTSGDYLIIASAEHNVNSTTNTAELALDINGTDYFVATQVQQDSTNYRTWNAVKYETFAASSQTIKIQYRSIAASTVTIRRARIVALRVSAFNANYLDNQLTRQTGTTSGMNLGTRFSSNFTPATSTDHILFSGGNWDYAGTTTQGFVGYEILGMNSTAAALPHASGGVQQTLLAIAGKKTYGAGDHAAAFQYAQSNTTGSSDTIGADEMALCFLELGSKSSQYAEALTGPSVASTTYSDHATLTFTPDASSTYLFLATTIADNSAAGTATSLRCRLQNTTAASTLQETQMALKGAGDKMCLAMAALYTEGGSPVSTTWKTQLASSAGTNTTIGYDSRITALKLDSNDQSSSSTGESSTASTSRQDKVTITFTPGSQGDYLIIMGCDVKHSSTTSANGIDTVIDVDGVEYSLTRTGFEAADDYRSILQFVKVNLTAVSHTLKLRYSNIAASGTASIRNAYLVALRCSDFTNVVYAEQRTRQTAGTAKDFRWETALSTTATLNAGAHIFLGVGALDYNTITRQAWGRIVDNILLPQTQVNEEPASNTNEHPFFTFRKITTPAELYTAYFLTTADTTSSNTVGVDDMVIAALQVGT